MSSLLGPTKWNRSEFAQVVKNIDEQLSVPRTPRPSDCPSCVRPTAIASRKDFGPSLRPVPPGASKRKDTRYIDIHEGDELDEAQMATWVKQAAALPGWVP